MDNKFDISAFVNVETQQTVLSSLVDRVKSRRKESKLTQKNLPNVRAFRMRLFAGLRKRGIFL